ncbi:hypothetical protein K461DRAFT_324992 [Myriangium duriaei CBS 260.36]|uniref:Uncharacterized protein n=1 Tax=Myriangium duriaei CBS 260.36 TaxID=1168546 RepID=A0A9P4ITH1_9PEZI|nr:hypothetical protein K461DRAFT_324992 [Myriangium duriaei CBS 260.36]
MSSAPVPSSQKPHKDKQDVRCRQLDKSNSPARHMNGNNSTVWGMAAGVMVPMIIVDTVLVAIIFLSNVDLTRIPLATELGPPVYSGIPGDTYPQPPDPASFYISMSSTLFIFFASRASMLAVFCSSMLVSLSSYLICKTYLARVELQNDDALPTAYQFALIIRFLSNPSWSSLWSWLSYCSKAQGQRKKQSDPVKQVAVVTVLAISLGLLVFGADAWLHDAVKTVPTYDITAFPRPVLFDFALNTSYTNCNNATCYVDEGAESTFTLKNVSMSLAALDDTWTTTSTVFPNESSRLNQVTVGKYDSMGADATLAYLTVYRDPDWSVDFRSTTFGVQTQCFPSKEQCVLDSMSEQNGTTIIRCGTTKYNFNQSTSGSISSQTNYFTNSSRKASAGTVLPGPYEFYFNYAIFIPGSQELLSGSQLNNSLTSEIGHDSTLFELECTIRSYSIIYYAYQGMVRAFDTYYSNHTVGTALLSPMAMTTAGLDLMERSIQISTATRNSLDEVANDTATAYSTTAVALAYPAFQPVLSSTARLVQNTLVTRIKRTPLFTFIAVNLLYVVIGLVIAIMTVLTASDQRVHDLQARLSITGLVVDRFEGGRRKESARNIQDLFEEFHYKSSCSRITVRSNEAGGMTFATTKDRELASRRGSTSELSTDGSSPLQILTSAIGSPETKNSV